MVDIGEILSNFNCKRIGNDTYRMLCPFHKDTKTPNLTIYVETGTYYCFACNEHGDVDKLYCKLNGIDYSEFRRKQKPEIDLNKKQVNFKNQVNLIASRVFYEKLKKSLIGEVLEKMKEFDKRLRSVEFIGEEEINKYLELL